MSKWQLNKTIETDDIVLDYFSNSENFFLRLNNTITCISKESLEVEWEYSIKFSSPIGYYKIYVLNDILVYLSVDFELDKVVYTGIDLSGNFRFEIKNELRPYSNGIIEEYQSNKLIILSYSRNSRYLMELDVEKGKLINKQTINVEVFHLTSHKKNIYLGGTGGLFILNKHPELITSHTVAKFFKTETELFFLNETSKLHNFELKKVIKDEEISKIDDLIIDSSEKQFIERAIIEKEYLYFSSSNYGGLQCYNIKKQEESWWYGKSKYVIGGITFNKEEVIVLTENLDAEVELFKVINGVDEKIEEIESEIMPEVIVCFENYLFVSGLMGIEIYKQV